MRTDHLTGSDAGLLARLDTEPDRAMEALVGKAGGNIAARAAVLAEGDAANRDDILFLAPLPLFKPDGTVL